MKKAFLILVVLVLIAAAAAWFLFNRFGVSDGASLVAGDTVAYVTLPDVMRSGERWPETALAKIGADPSVAAFLEKPMGLMAGSGGDEATEILMKLKPGRVFLAVPSVTPEMVPMLVGFQYFGTRKDLDDAMARLHAELQSTFPEAAKTTSDYQGDAVTAFPTPSGTLFSASNGSWGFLANDEKTLQAALDRAAGRVKDGSLAESEDFQKVASKLAAAPDLAWYVNPVPFFDLISRLGEDADADLNDYQMAELKKVRGLGGSLVFDGLNQREVMFILMSEMKSMASISKDTMKLTTSETTAFFTGVSDWSQLANPEYLASMPEEFRTFFEANKIDLPAVVGMLGDETALVANWPGSAMIPSLMAALSIKDRAGIERTFDQLSASFGLDLSSSELNGARVVALPNFEIQLIEPVMAITDEYVFLALTRAELTRVLDQSADAKTLESAPAFAAATALFSQSSQGFAYIDAKAIFERVYNQARPMVIFGAAMMPDLADKVDVSKLPETEAIAQYLEPIVFSQRQVEDGWMVESSGPITLNQAVGVMGLGLGAAAVSGLVGQ